MIDEKAFEEEVPMTEEEEAKLRALENEIEGDDKMYLYDLLSTDPALALKLQNMAEGLTEERLVQIITGLAIRAAASVNNRNPIEGYYWAILTADIIQAICIKDEVDPTAVSEFINTENFEYLLRQFESVNADDLSKDPAE